MARTIIDASMVEAAGIPSTYGAIDTYMFAYRVGDTTEDTTYAGSSMYPSGIAPNSLPVSGTAYNGYVARGTSVLTGTWKAMGSNNSQYDRGATLFLRIS